MKTSYDIIIRPILTEKAVNENEKYNKLVFEVALNASKVEIRKAFEDVFGVKVKDVKTVIIKPKPKRVGFGQPGFTRKWKKAIVKVESEKPINIAELI